MVVYNIGLTSVNASEEKRPDMTNVALKITFLGRVYSV